MGGRWTLMILHSALAAAFFFSLQRWALNQSLETSLVWAVVAAVGAAWLAWSQQNRR